MTFTEKLEPVKQGGISQEQLYESITEYDIDGPKRYDMKFGSVKQFILTGYEGEKIRVRLASNTLPTLQKDFKVRINDIKKTA